MTDKELDQILKTLKTSAEKDGFAVMPESGNMTLYVSHSGGTLTVSRVEGVKSEGDIVYARTAKKEIFAVARMDIFAVATEAANGVQARRTAGFV
jgi:hypothetical protein